MHEYIFSMKDENNLEYRTKWEIFSHPLPIPVLSHKVSAVKESMF